MTNKIWFGANGRFSTPGDWSPPGVPQAGDTAFIFTGSVGATNLDLSGVNLLLGHFQSTGQPTLILRNTTVGNIALGSDAPVPDGGGFQTIVVAQHDTITGNVAPSFVIGDQLNVDLRRGATLVNHGTITTVGAGTGATIDISGPPQSFVENDGLIQTNLGQVTIDSHVIGVGTMELLGNTTQLQIENTMTLGSSVGAGQTVLFSGQAASPAVSTLQLDSPGAFHAIIDGFAGTDIIELANTKVTSDVFSGGVLKLSDGPDVVARLHFGGSYTTADFSVSNSGGNAVIAFAGSSHG